MAENVLSRVHFTEEDEDKEEDEEPESGLLVELEGKDEKKQRETNLWFSKVCFVIYFLTEPFRSSESAACFLRRVFSLRLTWRKMPRTSFSSRSGYRTPKKVEERCRLCLYIKHMKC